MNHHIQSDVHVGSYNKINNKKKLINNFKIEHHIVACSTLYHMAKRKKEKE